MDKSVLIEKRKNFLNATNNSPELFLKNYFNPIYFIEQEKLLNFILNRFINEITISFFEIKEKIQLVFNKYTTLDKSDILQLCKNNNIYCNFKLENTKYSSNKIIELITSKYEALFDNLEKLNRVASNEFIDSSIWCMYLSYGMLRGEIEINGNTKKHLNSPIFCIPISFKKNKENNTYIIEKQDDKLFVNEILEMTLNSHYKVQLNILNNIEENGFSLNESFKNISKVIDDIDLSDNSEGKKLIIYKEFSISLFNPIGGKMLCDYDEILNENYSFPVVNDLIKKTQENLIYENDEIIEINRPSNLIQKIAIANAMYDNTLIYGPPGTGKSEVVTNIIANAVFNNKNVFVVSEKKAALDVLNERLGKLNDLVIFAFDGKFRDHFYKNILSLNEELIKANPSSIQIDNSKYLEIKKYLEKQFELLNLIDKCGMHIYECKKIFSETNFELLDKNKIVFDYLLKLNITDLNKKIKTFFEIKNEIKKIQENENIIKKIFTNQELPNLINKLEKIKEKDLPYLLNKFLLTGEISFKKTIIEKISPKTKIETTFTKFIDVFKKIIDEKIIYFEYQNELENLLNKNVNIAEIIQLNWWFNNDLFKLFLNNDLNIDSLLNNYWLSKKHSTKYFDELIKKQYIANLKNIILNNKELEHNWVELTRKANLSKKHNIYKVIKDHYKILKIAFPIWILSPDNAVSLVPLKKEEFWYGIFDEASQMKFERSLPLVYRSKISIVSGDDKQLKPTSFFSKSFEIDEEFDGHLDNVESLLDKSKTSNWINFTLSNHYRSKNEQLIKFSNDYIYDGKLTCITENGFFDNPIDVYDVNGVYGTENGESINIIEANKVINLLLENNLKYKKILVITFNQKQSDFIYNNAYSKVELTKKIDENLIKFRSLENVQGDEADLVIISTTFGKNKNGKFLQNFGPINQDGGKNRINVMVTRAKDKMIVVKSFNAKEITNDYNENAKIFKNFIMYVENINKNIEFNKLLNENELTEFEKGIEEELINVIANTNLKIEKKSSIGTHKFDFYIKNNINNNIALCICVDDFIKLKNYKNDLKYWINTFDKQKYFIDRNYKIIRINQIDWLINKKIIVEKINKIINNVTIQ